MVHCHGYLLQLKVSLLGVLKSIAPVCTSDRVYLRANMDEIDMFGASQKSKFNLRKSDYPNLMKF